MTRNWFVRYAILAFLSLSLVVGGAIAPSWFSPAVAQLPPVLIPRVPLDGEAARQVYSQLPELPQENQYIDRETGDRAEDNTLVQRLILYHLLVQGRAPFTRLDWKLTLADYLGANELMFQDSYPSAQKLETNPLNGDRAAIVSLSRQQREELVMALVQVFNPEYGDTTADTPEFPLSNPSTATIDSQPEDSQPEAPPNNLPALPQPGDADLLRF